MPRSEYPRPDFVREEWLNLNGDWSFQFDDIDKGEEEEWFNKDELSSHIIVPFPYQSKASGIGDPSLHDIIWYQRFFELPEEFFGKRILLHFGAVDFQSKVWVNGACAGENRGGYVPFTFDITNHITKGKNNLVLRVVDTQSRRQPRGKQYWELDSSKSGIFYSRTSGIWQTVWLEPVNLTYIKLVKITSDIDREKISLQIFLDGEWTTASFLNIEVFFKGKIVTSIKQQASFPITDTEVSIPKPNFWSPETPDLYNTKLTLLQKDKRIDEVESYFGMRKVSIENGFFCLNNKPYFLRMAIDSGYFPQGNQASPSDEVLKQDVEMAKRYGFNGVRKHQKVPEPRYLYWTDKLGLLVWGEMPDCQVFDSTAAFYFISEYTRFIRRDYNHPSIVCWMPFNERWGIGGIVQHNQQQWDYVRSVYYLTKDLDPTRPVIDNDGFEHIITDIVTIHDYSQRGDELRNNIEAFRKNPYAPYRALKFTDGSTTAIMLDGEISGKPVILSECGGIWYQNEEHFLTTMKDIIKTLVDDKGLSGFCFSQLYDVEQEQNGLMDYHRKPKINPEKIRKIVMSVENR